MTEELRSTVPLAEAAQELARAVVAALDGGGNRADVLASVITPADDPVLLAAGRVLGADVLAPCLLRGREPSPQDVDLVAVAARAFPPSAGSASSVWNHWGMLAAVQRVSGAELPGPPAGDAADLSWVTAEPWQQLTRRLAPMAALAGAPDSPLAAAVARRTDDIARGFVRAVRRRDWLQAASAGRWVAAAPRVPVSLGLDTGLEFVAHMGAEDARAVLHARAGLVLREGHAR